MNRKAALGEDRDSNRADAARCAGHRNRTVFGREAVPLQRHDRKHGRVARCTDRHGLTRAHAFGQRHQPVAFHSRLLGVGAKMGLAAAPAVEDDLVAGLPAGVAGRFYRAGEVDPGYHREPAHNRRLAGDCKPIFVIECGIFDTDGHVAVHQICFVEISERGLGSAVRLFDDDRLECRHVTRLLVMAGFMPAIHI